MSGDYGSTRRRFLAGAGLAALAGCAGGPDQDPEPGTTTTRSVTEAPTATETPTGMPVVEALEASSTARAGVGGVSLSARDDEGIALASVETATDRVVREPGEADPSFEAELEGAPGEVNTVVGRVEDVDGHTAEEQTTFYARTYDVFENPAIDVAAVYVPFMGDKWERCMPADAVEPAAGTYTSRDVEAVSRHADQMQGHGVTSVVLGYNGKDSENWRPEAILDVPLMAELPVEPNYTVSNALDWLNEGGGVREQLEDDLGYIRETFLSRENARRYDGRPVVSMWGVNWLAWGGNPAASRAQDEVLDEWGDWAGFVDYLRESLTVDGTAPYLIANVGTGLSNAPDQYGPLDREFDGWTTWTGKPRPGETTPWEDAYRRVEENFAALSRAAVDLGVDFAPTVFPGFDDRHNSCWGSDRHIPRGVDHFRQLLALADEHRTVDRINVATWNDWTEGTQIEPGAFRGTDYGTAYLDAISAFQGGG